LQIDIALTAPALALDAVSPDSRVCNPQSANLKSAI